MTLYDFVNKLLLVEYFLMVLFAALDHKYVACVYWFGAVILQLGIILGLK